MSITLVTQNQETPNEIEKLDVMPMTLFAAYLKEREGVNLLETDKGFAIYVITGNECYIRDIYVKPEFRKEKVASHLADLICEKAREAGCKVLTGSVCPTTKGSTASLQVLLGYGMRLHSATANLIIFIKDL